MSKYDSRALRREIEAFLDRYKMKPHEFGLLARNDTAFVARLRGCGRIGVKGAAEARLFMQRYEADPATAALREVAPLPPSSSEKMAARVERDRAQIEIDRATMRMGAAPVLMRPLPPGDPIAKVMIAGGPETPADAIRMVRERWPSIWSAIVAVAREQNMAPGALMMSALEEWVARQVEER
ncbi:hypothetical protein [Sphingomonas oryzagri]|uniref:Uncharacterized protein n=1 Tax=Sphingomonas oryzagri TaxID=3042314 RepID=A0ABT6N615_9SPHN|nr:hypothetical protein [Sphingomonas oryzagri]MDH7640541.1 hypothetical protein [Sphingomonas oryzagri]